MYCNQYYNKYVNISVTEIYNHEFTIRCMYKYTYVYS